MNRCPRFTIFVIVSVLSLLADLGMTALANRLRDSSKEMGMNFRVSSPYYGHDLKPMVSEPAAAWGFWRYKMFTNSLGFRDFAPREVPLQSKEHRILFIGDSVIEGIGVDYENTAIGLISRDLKKEKNIEVLNAGVIAYSSTLYLRKVKYLLETAKLKFDELVVCLDVVDAHNEVLLKRDDKGNASLDQQTIAREQNARSEQRIPKLAGLGDFIRDHTTLLRMIGRGIKRLYIGKEAAFDLNRRRTMWTIDPKLYEEFGKRGLELSLQSLDQLLALVKKHGISLTVVTFPEPDQIYHDDLDSKHVEFLKNWTSKNKVKFLNLYPDFIGKEDKETVLSRYFLKKDVHWSAEGHRLVAQKFLEFYSRASANVIPM